MRVNIEGRFRIRIWDKEGRLKEDVSVPNQLTTRGVITLMGRLARIQSPNITESEGNPINNFGGIRNPSVGVILESGFITLDRADRFQYYTLLTNNPVPALGDNRQWDNFGADAGIDNVDFRTGDNPLPRLNEAKPEPMPDEVASVFTFFPGVAATIRGIYVAQFVSGAFTQNIDAVLASAVLADPLSWSATSEVEITWNLKLSPTFV